ncbi:putative protein [Arabidopsis thaliana]|uniref:Mitochondrial import inner membrane translocase subunit TIM50 n=1 Tax=Arabidopsis thaliana TaxID=3702 RepID=Q9SVV8_ARATH|nr:putative protein [Arabidopsis thaliana]CAB78816.1 putative protein [Arabidopsis thaliana]
MKSKISKDSLREKRVLGVCKKPHKDVKNSCFDPKISERMELLVTATQNCNNNEEQNIGLDSSTRDVVTNEPQDLLVEDSSKNASNMDTIFSPVLDDELYSETDREPSVLLDAAEQYMLLPYLEDRSASSDDVKSDEDNRINRSRSKNLEAAENHTEAEQTEDFDPQIFLRNQPELADVVFNYVPDMQQPRDSPKRKAVTFVLIWMLLDILDPDGKFVSQRFYRDSCILSDGIYTKDLTVLGLDLAKVAIVDNCPQVYRLQINNGIPIKSWYDDPTDDGLITLLPFLETLADANDVRPVIAKRFGNKE